MRLWILLFIHVFMRVLSMQRVVVLSGAGVSAESGLRTFREDGGLWEGQRVTDGDK